LAGPDDARQSLCSVLVDGAGSRVLSPPRTAPSKTVRAQSRNLPRTRSAADSAAPGRCARRRKRIGKRHTQDFVVGVRLQPPRGARSVDVRSRVHGCPHPSARVADRTRVVSTSHTAYQRLRPVGSTLGQYGASWSCTGVRGKADDREHEYRSSRCPHSSSLTSGPAGGRAVDFGH